MQAPRWLWFSTSLLAVNVILVATTSIRAHMLVKPPAGQEKTATPDKTPSQAGEGSSQADESVASNNPPGSSSQVDLEQLPFLTGPREPRPTPDTSAGGAAKLDADLPAVPSLQEAQRLQSDPVYQEIRKMFSDEGGELESPPLSGPFELPATASPQPQTQPGEAYFKRLDQRLNTATQLCKSAHALASEAEVYAGQGDSQASGDLLIMATQLREMAADLLVRPLQ